MKQCGTIRKITLGVTLALCSLGAQAELNMQPGLWETTIAMHMPGMPMAPPPITQRTCISREDLVPKDPQSSKDCQRLDHQIEGDTVTWNAECKHAGGTTVGNGKIVYTGDNYQGSMEMEMRDGSGKVMKMSQTLSGHRVGDCPK
jgi:hypothetical protein